MRPLCLFLAATFIIPLLTLSNLVACEPIRILCINVRFSTANDGENRWENRKEFMTEIVIEGNYDFIGTQETLLHPSPEFNQKTYIASRLPGHGFYGRSREVNPDIGEAMILYYKRDRWRMDETDRETFWLSETPEVPGSRDADAAITRSVTAALFHEIREGQPTGRRVYVYNTHFDHRGELARQRAARFLMERIANRKDREAPVILIGDINSGERSPSVRYIQGETMVLGGVESVPPYRLVDTFRAVNPDAVNVGTFNGFRPVDTVWDGEKIDYIFVSPSFTTFSSEIIRTHRNGRFPTDHFPIDAVVVW